MLTRTTSVELQDTVDGRGLSYQLRGATPRQRAKVAKDLVTGEKQLHRPTRKQASSICKVSLPLVSAVMNGTKKPEPSRASMICVTWFQQASPEARTAFVTECGVAEVWDALATAVS
jgi:hypothetical protein